MIERISPIPKLVKDLAHALHRTAYRDMQILRQVLIGNDAVNSASESAEVLPDGRDIDVVHAANLVMIHFRWRFDRRYLYHGP